MLSSFDWLVMVPAHFWERVFMITLPSLPLDPGTEARPPNATETAVRNLLSSIQGGILSSAGRGKCGALLFFRFCDPMAHAANAQAIVAMKPCLTTALKQYWTGAERKAARACAAARSEDKSFRGTEIAKNAADFGQETFNSLALTGYGLECCGLARGSVLAAPDFDRVLYRGMHACRTKNPQNPHPEIRDWQGIYTERFCGVRIIGQGSETALCDAVRHATDWGNRNGIKTVHIERGIDWRPDHSPREPFGYEDGVSMPRFFEYEKKSLSGNPLRCSPPHGAADIPLCRVFSNSNTHHDCHRLGTFLVFRKLEQNVAAFRQEPNRQTRDERVGRGLDGVPLVGAADATQIRGDLRDRNDFNFDHDSEPSPVCPFSAHIRRSNPRGQPSNQELVPDLVRRSWVYGSRSDLESREAVSCGVGLLFLAYVRTIEQFFTVNDSWLESSDHPFANTGGRDPLVHGESPLGRFVKTLGGEFFYVPAMDWFDELACR